MSLSTLGQMMMQNGRLPAEIADSYQQGQQAGQVSQLNQMKLGKLQTDQANQSKLAQLRQQFAGGDRSALSGMAAIDPKAAEDSMSVNSEQERAGWEEIAYMANWADTPEKWAQAVAHVEQTTGQPLDQRYRQFSPEIRQQTLQEAMQRSGLAEKLAKQRTEAKAPTVRTMKTADGKEFEAQWNPQTGAWDAISEEAPRWNPNSRGMTVTGPDGTQISFGGSSGELGTKVRNDIQGRKYDSVEALSRLSTVNAQFKPEFLELGTRWNALATSWKEKAGFAPDPKDKQALMEFSKFKRAGLSNVNRTVKEITGAAMSDGEAQRIMAELPNPGKGLFDGDSPSEFKSKMDSAVRDTKRAIIRANYALANNMDPLKTGIELSDVDELIDRRGAELEQAFRQKNPNASPDAVQMQVRDQLSREFGLE